MNQVLIDSDILSLFFRGNKQVIKKFQEYLLKFNRINISIITYYEILSGLKYKDSKKQLSSFLKFCEQSIIIPLTQESIIASSDIYSVLRKNGNLIDDIDLLIAGIAISNDMYLATHNTKHFNRIDDLGIEDWAEAYK